MEQYQRNTVGAILLIAFGIVFLLGQVFEVNFWSMLGISWPVFILLPGIVFLVLAFTGDSKMSGFVFPGAIVTGTGAILFYQSVTNHWESWSYAWALYPAFVGLAMMFNGQRNRRQQEIHNGRNLVNFGIIAFLVGAAFFELLIFNRGGALTGWVLPLVLIGVGGYLLLTRQTTIFSGSEKRKVGDEPPGDDLRRQIDEALNESEPGDPA